MGAVERVVGCGAVDLEGLAELRNRPGTRLRQRRLRQQRRHYWAPCLSQKATAWWVGAVFDWSPVTNLDFAFDAIYESSHQSTPVAGFVGANAWKANSDGFNGRLRITRSF